MSASAYRLLEKSQELASGVLAGTGRIEDQPSYPQLMSALEELKSAVPGVEQRLDYTRTYSRSSGSRTSAYAVDERELVPPLFR